MYKQAAIIALEETAKNVSAFDNIGHTGMSPMAVGSLKARTITGINIVKRLLEESAPKDDCEVHVISFGFADMEPKEGKPDPFKAMIEKLQEEMQAHKAAKCPRCHNEEISPSDKFCKICGMALMAEKGAE